jgi:hypothetical protein
MSGRAGNQLFQIACCIATAKKHGVDYYIPNETASPETWEFYFKDKFPIYTKEMKMMLRDDYYEPSSFNFVPVPYRQGTNLLLHGYWQTEKHFSEYREDILKAFDFMYNGIKYPYVSIHVRRGDYLELEDKHPTVNDSYLKQAIKIFSDKGHKFYMVYSDDYEWCKKYFMDNYPDLNFTYSVGNSAVDDLTSMSCCEHNIISNSSFSWWGAWLNRNPNKIVVSPSAKNWFGKGNSHLLTENIIPESWVQIEY